ncbi:hypothetical protein ScPMuIL_017802 [Solemya velum]
MDIPDAALTQLSPTSNVEWVAIQKNTFKNWVNEQLKPKGLLIQDLRTDISDGLYLVVLVEALQRRTLSGVVREPGNQYERIQNITVALEAITADNVKIVTIDSTHIAEGNVKLILALLWQLILRYQIGLSNIQNKHYILAWLKAVIPECRINNFTTDWNSGVALNALLDFCHPGLCPSWRSLDARDRENNCRDAMKLARQQFGIPLILRPEDLASPQLDELSAITYLSYFIKVGAPGYIGTLTRIQPLVMTTPVFNFTTDWNDGRVLCELVNNLGADIPDWTKIRGTNVRVIQVGIDGAQKLGVDPILSASQIASENSEHLGLMTYAAQFLLIKPTVGVYRNYQLEKVRFLFRFSLINFTIVLILCHCIDIRVVYEDRTDTRSSQHSLLRIPSPLPTSYAYSGIESTTISPTVPGGPSYSLIRKPSLTRAQMKAMEPMRSPPPVTTEMTEDEGVKVDTYSVGVIISTTSHQIESMDGVRIESESPSGRVVKMTGDGLYHAQFSPDEIGEWKVSLYVNDKYVDTCPVDVCDPSQVKITEIKSGMAGRSQAFMIDATKAGSGKLDVDIKHEGHRVPCFLHESRKGVYKATFTPYTSGQYRIAVIFNRAEIRDIESMGADVEEMQRRAVFNTTIKPEGDHYKIRASCDWQIDYLTGGPITVHYGDASDIRVYSMQDGTICQTPHLIADCTAAPDGKLTAEVTHDGYKFPADIVEESSSVYRISFRPRGRGTYKVWLVHDGNVVKGSPFIQEIDELVSPTAVGDGLVKGKEGTANTFTVDGRGFPGTLSCNVDGPSGSCRSHITELPDGTHEIVYYPEEVGRYLIQVTLDGRDIEGSPFHPKISNPDKVRVSGGWRSLMDAKERIPLAVNKEKHIPFDASDAGQGELTAIVHGPSSKIPVAVDSRGDGKHTLIFTPREEGKHYIDVYWAGFPLHNSPFNAYAVYGPDNDMESQGFSTMTIHKPVPVRSHNGPSNIEAAHPYLEAYTLPIPTAVNRSSTSVNRSPSSVSRSTVTSQPPRIRVAGWKPAHGRWDMKSQPQHRIRPTDNGPSPKVVLSGKGLKEAHVNKPATFKVDGRKAGPGDLDVHMGSVRTDVPVKVEPIGHKQYRCSYVPPMPGAYLLDIKWNDRQLKCCPFKINVHNPVYPRKVSVMGDNLQGGVVGKDIHLTIDPREAGKGDLKVKCTGPNEADVPVTMIDNYDGTFSLKMKPQEPGEHLLEIKYNDEHIHGSPYVIVVRTSPSMGTVKLYGPGIENGLLSGFEGHFWVDARGAGSGELHVSIMGPKGAFHVEMQRASQKDKLFHCRYNPHEAGVYTINAQWSGVHIDGSPYRVHIGTSESDLKDMLERASSLKRSLSPKHAHHEIVF